tara:strand:- start:107 stop:217 length:111 start_codon:yes stop_codon:yes gene_type:complete
MNTRVLTIDREAIMMTTITMTLFAIAVIFKILGEMI